MTIEGLGNKFQEARLARNLTLDEAARLTKIRPSRLAEIEADDFSNFPSLAYAKGFLQIYGKFLDVDVSSYMEAFETSEHVTVDGYSYLQEEPAPAPVRTRAPSVQRTTSDRPSLLPLGIGIVVLVIGGFAIKLFLDIQRLAPRSTTSAPATATTQSAPALTSAPLAPAAETPAVISPTPAAVTAPAVETPAAVAAATAAPIAESSPPPRLATSEGEPEVRRAEAVNSADLANVAATSPTPTPTPTPSAVNRIDVRPLRKTYIEVTVGSTGQTQGYWISPEQGPIQLRGKRLSIRVLDPSAVQFRKNGKPLAPDDPNITIQ